MLEDGALKAYRESRLAGPRKQKPLMSRDRSSDCADSRGMAWRNLTVENQVQIGCFFRSWT